MIVSSATGELPPGVRAGTIHAGCVLLGEAGVLIRGGSGTGKSALARRLVHRWNGMGIFAKWVADDRTNIASSGGRLVARPVPPLAGRSEIRGLGIVAVPHEPAAVIRIILDCNSKEPQRFPGGDTTTAELAGVVLPRLVLRVDADAEHMVAAALLPHVTSR